MQRIALRTRVKPGSEAAYDADHARLLPGLERAMREAGARVWRIWRDGLDLFHYVEVVDYAVFQARITANPINQAWQKQMNRHLDGDFDPSAGPLGKVWEMSGAVRPRAPFSTVFGVTTTYGFGAAPLGNLFTALTDEEASAAVEAAWDSGIRYFDTAPHYGLGLSERRLGRVLADKPRGDFVLSTKVGRLLVPSDGIGKDDQGFDVPKTHVRAWDFSGDGVRRSIEESLERLGLDSIDVALIHDPDTHWAQAVGEAFPALAELRDQGVVKAIGVGMNQWPMLADFVRETDIDTILLAGRYTLLDQSAATELLPLCVRRGVSVVAGGVFNSGLLARHDVTGGTFNYVPAPDDVVARAREIAAVCEKYDVTLPQAAMAFPLRHPAVSTVVLGMRSVQEVRGNMELAARPVPEALWEELGF
ncbi:aldo/keto reductase [Herbidospora sp. RD11066]